MIHRFEVDPPQSAVNITWPRNPKPDPGANPMFETYEWVPTRMAGGRNEFGEFLPPCLIVIDDEEELGQYRLECIEKRLAAGKLPYVKPFEPKYGLTDSQIDAEVERRVKERMDQIRFEGGLPSPEFQAELSGVEQEGESAVPVGSPTMPYMAQAHVATMPAIIIEEEEGKQRCPLDNGLFDKRAFKAHFRMNSDIAHQEMLPQIWPA